MTADVEQVARMVLAERIAMRLSLVRFTDEESDRMIELTMREAWPLAHAIADMLLADEDDGYKAAQVEILREAAEAWGDGHEGFPYHWLLNRACEIEAGKAPDWSAE
jgi:hypothetical protein